MLAVSTQRRNVFRVLFLFGFIGGCNYRPIKLLLREGTLPTLGFVTHVQELWRHVLAVVVAELLVGAQRAFLVVVYEGCLI